MMEALNSINFNHALANQYLKDTLSACRMMKGLIANLFVLIFLTPKEVEVVCYHGIGNKSCPVVIKGKPETKQFIWNVGCRQPYVGIDGAILIIIKGFDYVCRNI